MTMTMNVSANVGEARQSDILHHDHKNDVLHGIGGSDGMVIRLAKDAFLAADT